MAALTVGMFHYSQEFGFSFCVEDFQKSMSLAPPLQGLQVYFLKE
jgi:hypothetical protein